MNHLRKGEANLCKSIRDETALPEGSFRGYWTVRFKVMGRTAPPELAVTVSVKFDGVGGVPLPPPPHAAVRQSASSRDASAA
jgi:hypothetical protein